MARHLPCIAYTAKAWRDTGTEPDMDLPIRDRREAGRQLATMLSDLRNREDVLVLGLPRGGVPVAYEVATALGAPPPARDHTR